MSSTHLVTSSTERDLRFYDCTAKTFTLKIIITSWEYMLVVTRFLDSCQQYVVCKKQ